jgi:hypothetical protein
VLTQVVDNTLCADFRPVAVVRAIVDTLDQITLTQDPPEMSPCLTSLPDGILKLVMQHVPLKDRLGSCCLVSKQLHAAAVAATDAMTFTTTNYRNGYELPRQPAESAMVWLCHYGQQLTSLELALLPQPIQQLPCPNLQELTLSACQVQLGAAADGQPGVLQGCTKLKQLSLSCDILDTPESRAVLESCSAVVDCGLSSLVHLQHLELAPKRQFSVLKWYEYDFELPCLQHLTYLKYHCEFVDSLLQISHLTNLQELHVWAPRDTLVGPKLIPGLMFPASLQKLVLLSPLEAGLLSLVPTGLKFLRVERVIEGPSSGSGSFLSYMARLQALTRLELPYGEFYGPPAGPAYSALTASSSLVSLHLADTVFPTEVWSHVFPAGCILPHLTLLMLDESSAAEDRTFATWSAVELSRLVSCCPGLCTVDRLSMQPGVHVSELFKLTALTNLSVSYGLTSSERFGESVRGLAAVTQLRRLKLVHVSQKINVASLLPLTRLTALTDLWVAWYPEVCQPGDCGYLHFEDRNTQVRKPTVTVAVTVTATCSTKVAVTDPGNFCILRDCDGHQHCNPCNMRCEPVFICQNLPPCCRLLLLVLTASCALLPCAAGWRFPKCVTAVAAALCGRT